MMARKNSPTFGFVIVEKNPETKAAGVRLGASTWGRSTGVDRDCRMACTPR